MGSRGSSSKTKKIASSSVMFCKDYNEVEKHMSSYGLKMDSSLKNIPFSSLKDACYGIEVIAKDFKKSCEDVTLKASKLKNDKTGAVTETLRVNKTGKICFDVIVNTSWFGKNPKDWASIPKGQVIIDKKTTTSHEMGHVINNTIALQKYPNKNPVDAMNKYSTEKYALGIVKSGQSASVISNYATENHQEFVAECFGDVARNGASAQKISKIVYNSIYDDYRNGVK